MSDTSAQNHPKDAEPVSDKKDLPLAEIENAIRSIRYGSVQIIIQDGLVVQIDKTEKLRLR
ncbi:MAG: YezD family protein [Armatimonas sp.]